MLSIKYLSKSSIYTPLRMSQRWRVRVLPPIYDEFETPYMKSQKPGRHFITDFFFFMHCKNPWRRFIENQKMKHFEACHEYQRFNPDRHRILGADLATVHFMTSFGAKVKFTGNDRWYTYDDIKKNEIPSSFVPGFFVEEVDASGMEILYEGFDNLCNLSKLKKLSFRNCPFIDDWCLSRFHMFQNTLECLDLSGCPLVSERGICTLHVLKKLKTLIIKDTLNIQNKELVALLLQDVLPECDVIGIDYKDPVLLKRVENFMN